MQTSLRFKASYIIIIFSLVTFYLAFIFETKMVRELKEIVALNDKREKLFSLLKVHSVYNEKGPINMVRYGRANDGGYVVPEDALSAAEALMSYGIADDNSFEEQFSEVHNKPSYGFDCGIETIESKSKLFFFRKECIATDNFLYNKSNSSKNISSFSQQLHDLDLKNKKIFVKMDIEGAEYEAFEDIIKYSSSITGIVLEIHFVKPANIDKAIKLLLNLQQQFLLVHVHGNNCTNIDGYSSSKNSLGNIPAILELTYINKNLVTNHKIADNQAHPLPIDMPNCPHLSEAEFEILLGE